MSLVLRRATVVGMQLFHSIIGMSQVALGFLALLIYTVSHRWWWLWAGLFSLLFGIYLIGLSMRGNR